MWTFRPSPSLAGSALCTGLFPACLWGPRWEFMVSHPPSSLGVNLCLLRDLRLHWASRGAKPVCVSNKPAQLLGLPSPLGFVAVPPWPCFLKAEPVPRELILHQACWNVLSSCAFVRQKYTTGKQSEEKCVLGTFNCVLGRLVLTEPQLSAPTGVWAALD